MGVLSGMTNNPVHRNGVGSTIRRMGDYSWLLIVFGAAMWAVLIWAAVSHFRHREADGCPDCSHRDGVNRGHCANSDSYSGWGSDVCRCENNYHWSVGIDA